MADKPALSAAAEEHVKERAAKDAVAAFERAVKLHGHSPEVLALVVEGLFTAAAGTIWRNRRSGVKAVVVRDHLRALVNKALKNVAGDAK